MDPAATSPRVERASRPIPVPACVAGARRVLFFGGSFDPPHRGHTELPFAAASARWPGQDAWVVFVPAARSPHKDHQPAPDAHRVEMLRLALQGRRRWWTWEQELADASGNPGQPSYWADTWLLAARAFPRAERSFLIGVDQALAMHRWRRFGEFWRDALVVLRPGSPDPVRLREGLRDLGVWSDAEVDDWMSRLVRTATVDASSSAVREALADPAQRNARIEGLDPGVQRYILSRGLYTPA